MTESDFDKITEQAEEKAEHLLHTSAQAQKERFRLNQKFAASSNNLTGPLYNEAYDYLTETRQAFNELIEQRTVVYSKLIAELTNAQYDYDENPKAFANWRPETLKAVDEIQQETDQVRQEILAFNKSLDLDFSVAATARKLDIEDVKKEIETGHTLSVLANAKLTLS